MPLPEESCSHEMALSAGPVVLETAKRTKLVQPFVPDAGQDIGSLAWIVSLDLDPPRLCRSLSCASSNGNRAPPVNA